MTFYKNILIVMGLKPYCSKLMGKKTESIGIYSSGSLVMPRRKKDSLVEADWVLNLFMTIYI